MSHPLTAFLHRNTLTCEVFFPVEPSTQQCPHTLQYIGHTINKRNLPLPLSTHLSRVHSGHLGCTQTHSWNQTLALHAGNSSPPQWWYTKFQHKNSMPSAQSPLMLFSSGLRSSSAEQTIISCPLYPCDTPPRFRSDWLCLQLQLLFFPFKCVRDQCTMPHHTWLSLTPTQTHWCFHSCVLHDLETWLFRVTCVSCMLN